LVSGEFGLPVPDGGRFGGGTGSTRRLERELLPLRDAARSSKRSLEDGMASAMVARSTWTNVVVKSMSE
jgi:hypothetical protein